ncbi:MAG: hypothetical protein J4224_00905 [Candidatus Diapherotrites archaeon]|uniref:Glycerophosphoryl diester phosphodiesterase membrane domain-containing protein n=1 Tax=Candidatus Iainarchaeum sp. TaxID=3101447 RepID=A0A7J4IY71_9ARCH|nr:MAG: hypothetical protein QT03_C0001G0492 [archaeon GW2011_AR10]MBS3058968.1 hypothetical protein [Candidatus Diapherotrites archaeon]HIH08747.1 hypothetical protein [Candidatus Diapherotrites archaeon]
MFSALVQGLKDLALKPSILLPAIVFVLFNAVLAALSQDTILEFFYNVIFLEQLPYATNWVEFFYFFVMIYFWQLLALALVLFLAYTASFWMAFSYSAFVKNKGKTGAVASSTHALSRIGSAVSLAVFFGIVTLLYGFLLMVFFLLTSLPGENIVGGLGLLLFLLWLVFGVYLLVKLLFLPYIVGVEESKTKNAVEKAWQWSGKHFFGIIVVSLIVGIIANVIALAGSALSDFFGESLVAVAVVALFVSVSVAYSNLVFAHYYNSTR